MESIRIVLIAITVVIFILKFSLGLNTDIRSMSLTANSMIRVLWMVLVVIVSAPLVSLLITNTMQPSKGALIAIIFLAAAPGAPLSTIKVFKAGGRFKNAIVVQMVTIIISVFTVPLILRFFYNTMNLEVEVNWWNLMERIFLVVLLPFIAGMLIRLIRAGWIAGFAHKLTKFANYLQSILGIVILIYFHQALFNAAISDYLIFVIFVSLTLVLGHISGPPSKEARTESALLSISRHVGLVLFIITPVFPLSEIVTYLLPYMVVNVLVGMIYARWRKE